MSKMDRRTSLAETRSYWRLSREDALKLRLRRSPPDLWYEIARRADPNHHADLLFWMLNQKQCDFAVAAHILLTGPIRYHIEAQTPLPTHPDETTLWAVVLMNWMRGHYRAHDVACDRADLDPHLDSLRATLAARKGKETSFPMPEALLDLSGGHVTQLAAADDPDQDPDLWRLCHDLELTTLSAPPGLGRHVAQAQRTVRKLLIKGRDWVLAQRFQRRRHLFATQGAYLDWVSDYYVNRSRHDEILARLTDIHDPNPALRFGTAAVISAAMGFMVLGGAALGLMELLRGF